MVYVIVYEKVGVRIAVRFPLSAAVLDSMSTYKFSYIKRGCSLGCVRIDIGFPLLAAVAEIATFLRDVRDYRIPARIH